MTTLGSVNQVQGVVGEVQPGKPITIVLQQPQPTKGYEADNYKPAEEAKKKDKLSGLGTTLSQIAIGGYMGFNAVQGIEESGSAGEFDLGSTFEGITGTALNGAMWGAGIGGALSAVSNAMAVFSGKEKTPRAIGNVVGDVFTGALSGVGGAIGASLGASLLGSFGLAGLPLTIGAIALGALSAVGVGKLTGGVGKWISNAVAKMLGEKSAEQAPQPA